MIRFTIFLALIFSLIFSLNAQVRWTEVDNNRPLERHFLQHSSNDFSRNSNNAIYLDVPSGKDKELCFSNQLINGKAVVTVNNLACGTLLWGEMTFNGACINFQANVVTLLEKDKVCIELCNENGDCETYDVFVRVRTPLSIPFLEDFSGGGVYPDESRWMNNSVYVNNTLGYNPPTIGVATFDGLDASGSPYGGAKGIADELTSAFFDLQDYNQDDDVYLSFFIQPKGFGLRPRAEDVLRLEFLNASGEWKLVTNYPGISGTVPQDTSPAFTFRSVRLTQEYLHPAFQFRFSNINSRTGVRELWHLDYIRITEGFMPDEHNLDVAFTETPESIFFPYSAIPINQLKFNEQSYLNPFQYISIRNLHNSLLSENESFFVLEEVYRDFTIVDDLRLLELPPIVPQNQRDLQPGLYHFVNPTRSETWINRLLNISEISNDSMIIRTTYKASFNQENDLRVLGNNEVSRETVVKDYFAYDDGSAEIAISVHSNPGNLAQLAVKFNAKSDDFLQAVQIHFPHINEDVSNQLFNIKVWIGSLKPEADYTGVFLKPRYPDRVFDTLQGFTSYPLIDDNTGEFVPLFIPAGDFYIGWQQVTIATNDIPVGYDRNTPHGVDYIFFSAGGDWKPLSEESNRIDGSVMIRPSYSQLITSTEELDPRKQTLQFYPNPTTGTFRVVPSDEWIPDETFVEIYNTLGQLVHKEPLLDFQNLKSEYPGLYLIVVRDSFQQMLGQGKLLLLR